VRAALPARGTAGAVRARRWGGRLSDASTRRGSDVQSGGLTRERTTFLGSPLGFAKNVLGGGFRGRLGPQPNPSLFATATPPSALCSSAVSPVVPGGPQRRARPRQQKTPQEPSSVR